MSHRFTALFLPLIAAACTSNSSEKASLPAQPPPPAQTAEKTPAPNAATPKSSAAPDATKTTTAAATHTNDAGATKPSANDAAKPSANDATKASASETTKASTAASTKTSDSAQSASSSDAAKTSGDSKTADNLLALKVTTLDGKPADLASYKGKVALVVNVASQCGFTPQYAGLEELYKELEPKGFVILGFPSNDFGEQEPGSPEEIQTFCTKNYGVTFPLFAKVQTKPGAEQSPVYAYLNAATGKLPTWNFCKYLIGKDGKAIAFYTSKVKPSDADLRKSIDDALASK
jgi:glutathione peroxidase